MTTSRTSARLRKLLRSKLFFLILAALIGFAAFLVLYGTIPLDVTNDAWLIAGYDESDVLQHYSGWLAYRISPWRLPLGMAERMGVGTGTIITYTDSIPWVAFFFKLIRRFLPETFQYFGLYGLFCFMMQGAASWLLIEYHTKNRIYSLLGSVLFCFSPIMIERMFRHTALASHWLILFSLLIYFMNRDRPNYWYWLFLYLLETLAVGIHPYFLPMIVCFSFLCVLEDWRKRRYLSIPAFLGQQAFVLLVGYGLGAIRRGSGSGRAGFGEFCMNLNALFNPSSLGRYSWSGILPQLPQTLGNYDGFNYLGLGVLLALPAVLAAWLFIKVRDSAARSASADAGVMEKQERPAWRAWLSRNIWLLLACFGLTLYAVSNVVTFHDQVLFEYPLLRIAYGVCGVFRASARMFYPVYYLIFLSVLVLLWKLLKYSAGRGGTTRWACIACALLCVVQLWDMRGMMMEKRIGMRHKSETGMQSELYSEQTLADAIQNAERLMIVGPVLWADTSRGIAIWAMKNNTELYYTTSSKTRTEDLAGCIARQQELEQLILDSQDLHHTVVVTEDEEEYEKYMHCRNARAWKLHYPQDVYIIYEGEGE